MPIQATTLVKAFATLTGSADADITDAENVVIGGKTYTFKASLSSAGDVKRPTAFEDCLSNLAGAINLDGVAGTDYHTDMVKNDYAHAVHPAAGDDKVVTIRARASGLSGNLIAITKGTTALVLTDESGAKLDSGEGQIDDAIDELQAGAQLNSDVLTFLAWMEA